MRGSRRLAARLLALGLGGSALAPAIARAATTTVDGVALADAVSAARVTLARREASYRHALEEGFCGRLDAIGDGHPTSTTVDRARADLRSSALEDMTLDAALLADPETSPEDRLAAARDLAAGQRLVQDLEGAAADEKSATDATPPATAAAGAESDPGSASSGDANDAGSGSSAHASDAGSRSSDDASAAGSGSAVDDAQAGSRAGAGTGAGTAGTGTGAGRAPASAPLAAPSANAVAKAPTTPVRSAPTLNVPFGDDSDLPPASPSSPSGPLEAPRASESSPATDTAAPDTGAGSYGGIASPRASSPSSDASPSSSPAPSASAHRASPNEDHEGAASRKASVPASDDATRTSPGTPPTSASTRTETRATSGMPSPTSASTGTATRGTSGGSTADPAPFAPGASRPGEGHPAPGTSLTGTSSPVAPLSPAEATSPATRATSPDRDPTTSTPARPELAPVASTSIAAETSAAPAIRVRGILVLVPAAPACDRHALSPAQVARVDALVAAARAHAASQPPEGGREAWVVAGSRTPRPRRYRLELSTRELERLRDANGSGAIVTGVPAPVGVAGEAPAGEVQTLGRAHVIGLSAMASADDEGPALVPARRVAPAPRAKDDELDAILDALH